MTGTYGTAVMLLMVGMITVFAMLLIVYWVGTSIIRITNRLYKEVPVPKIPLVKPVNIESQKLAAVVSAVSVVTGGKAKITSIEKIK